jgi:hypothetical protein
MVLPKATRREIAVQTRCYAGRRIYARVAFIARATNIYSLSHLI